MGCEEGRVRRSPGSEEFVLFNFPREKLNVELDLAFVRPFAAEGDSGLGDDWAAVFVRGSAENEDWSMMDPVGVPSLDVDCSVSGRCGGGETLLRG